MDFFFRALKRPDSFRTLLTFRVKKWLEFELDGVCSGKRVNARSVGAVVWVSLGVYDSGTGERNGGGDGGDGNDGDGCGGVVVVVVVVVVMTIVVVYMW